MAVAAVGRACGPGGGTAMRDTSSQSASMVIVMRRAVRGNQQNYHVVPLAMAGDARATQRQNRSLASSPRRGYGKERGVDWTPTGKAWSRGQLAKLFCVCVCETPTETGKRQVFDLGQKAELPMLASWVFVPLFMSKLSPNEGRR